MLVVTYECPNCGLKRGPTEHAEGCRGTVVKVSGEWKCRKCGVNCPPSNTSCKKCGKDIPKSNIEVVEMEV